MPEQTRRAHSEMPPRREDGPAWVPLLTVLGFVVGVISLFYMFVLNDNLNYLLYPVLFAIGFATGAILWSRRALARKQRELDSRAVREGEVETLLLHEEEQQRRRHGVTRTFKPGEDLSYNEDFYAFFIKKLTDATKSIYITGEGFECRDDEGKKFAQRFADAHAKALDDHCDLYIERIQTKSLISKPWADMLQGLLIRFGERFVLTLEPRVQAGGAIVSVCVIDPDSDSNSTVELMVSVNRIVRGDVTSKAGVAFFHEHDKEFAKDMLDKISGARSLAGYRRISSIDEACGRWLEVDGRPHFQFDTTPLEPSADGGSLFYFAYGSNMDPSQMRRRCESAVRKGVGILVGHRLVFNRKGDYVEGGVASIVTDANRNVQGTVYALTAEDLEVLDAAEVATSYERVSRSVVLLDGTSVNCFVYVAYPQGDMDADQEYLERVIQAAESVDLAPEYLESLKGFRTDPSNPES